MQGEFRSHGIGRLGPGLRFTAISEIIEEHKNYIDGKGNPVSFPVAIQLLLHN